MAWSSRQVAPGRTTRSFSILLHRPTGSRYDQCEELLERLRDWLQRVGCVCLLRGDMVRGQVGKPVACLGVQGQGLAGPSYCHVEQVDLLHHFIGQRLTWVVNEEFLDLL